MSTSIASKTVTRLVMNKREEIRKACEKGHSLQLVLAPEEDETGEGRFTRHAVEFYNIPTNIVDAGVFLARTPSINRHYIIRVHETPDGGVEMLASYEA